MNIVSVILHNSVWSCQKWKTKQAKRWSVNLDLLHSHRRYCILRECEVWKFSNTGGFQALWLTFGSRLNLGII